MKQIAVLSAGLILLILLLAGCGNEKNAAIAGRWEATKANIHGETISFAELDTDSGDFCFEFREDGSCTAVLGGVKNEGTYTFNATTVDILYGNKEEKLSYDQGVLTMTFYYNNEKTSYMFTKVE